MVESIEHADLSICLNSPQKACPQGKQKNQVDWIQELLSLATSVLVKWAQELRGHGVITVHGQTTETPILPRLSYPLLLLSTWPASSRDQHWALNRDHPSWGSPGHLVTSCLHHSPSLMGRAEIHYCRNWKLLHIMGLAFSSHGALPAPSSESLRSQIYCLENPQNSASERGTHLIVKQVMITGTWPWNLCHPETYGLVEWWKGLWKGWLRSQPGNNILWDGMLSSIMWNTCCSFPVDITIRILGPGNEELCPHLYPTIITPGDPEVESVPSVLCSVRVCCIWSLNFQLEKASTKGPHMGSTELKLPLLPDQFEFIKHN